MSNAPDQGPMLSRLYSRRFGSSVEYRNRVWRTLNRSFFRRWIAADAAVLDLGCGYGEFINNVTAGSRFAIDLNPDASNRVDSDVTVFIQDCSVEWPLTTASLDVVFSSNFFEHLPSKEHLRSTLAEAHRCLRPGGTLIALGPNIRLVPGQYWDFFDHHLPLSDLSLGEVMSDCGFEIQKSIAAFLPYTMSAGRQYPPWVLRLYLRIPIAWRFVGKQFLVVATRA